MSLSGLPAPGLKVPPYVSPILRRFAKGQSCTLLMPWCCRDWSTTVHCHARYFGVSGAAQKPHDFLGFHACHMCHLREKEAGFDDILRAMMLTQIRIYEAFGTLTPD